MKSTEFLSESINKDPGEYNDEAGMAQSNLETIVRSAQELEKHIGQEENLPEWCQEKLAVVKGMLVAVTDYMVSQDSLDDKQGDFAFNTDRIAEQLNSMLEGGPYDLPGIDYDRPGDTPRKPKSHGGTIPRRHDDEPDFMDPDQRRLRADQARVKKAQDEYHAKKKSGMAEGEIEKTPTGIIHRAEKRQASRAPEMDRLDKGTTNNLDKGIGVHWDKTPGRGRHGIIDPTVDEQGVAEGDAAPGSKGYRIVWTEAGKRHTTGLLLKPGVFDSAEKLKNKPGVTDVKVVPYRSVAEGHADQQRKIFKKNGHPVGEVGIDRESSPGNGQWYMKYYATGDDFGGYDSYDEAVDELKHLVNQFKAEGVAEGSYDDDKGITHTRGSLVAKLEALPKGSDDFEWNRIQAIHHLKQGNMLRAKYYMALMKRGEQGVAEGSKYKCSCHPGDPDPDCPVHGLEPMEVGDALDVKKGVSEGFGRNSGYEHGFASSTAPSLKRKRDHDSGDDEPKGMFTVMINGKPWKEASSNEAFSMAQRVANKHPDKKVAVKWPTGQLNTVKAQGVAEKITPPGKDDMEQYRKDTADMAKAAIANKTPMSKNQVNEFAGGMGASSVATAPGVGKGPKIGSLFGGSYAPKTPFNKKRKK